MGIALATQLIGADLPFLARLLERVQARDIERKPASGQIGGDTSGIGAQQFWIEHGTNQKWNSEW